MDTVYIYGLRCPLRDEIMYVGKSTNVEYRLIQHLGDARTGKKTPKSQWIASLLSSGLSPTAEILDTCDLDSSWTVETEWIKKYKEINPDLTNLPHVERRRKEKKNADISAFPDTDTSIVATSIIFNAVKLLEAKKGRPYSAQDIAKATGLHRHTVSSMLDGREDRTISKLLAFFAREGMPVTIGDLFVVTDDPTP